MMILKRFEGGKLFDEAEVFTSVQVAAAFERELLYRAPDLKAYQSETTLVSRCKAIAERRCHEASTLTRIGELTEEPETLKRDIRLLSELKRESEAQKRKVEEKLWHQKKLLDACGPCPHSAFEAREDWLEPPEDWLEEHEFQRVELTATLEYKKEPLARLCMVAAISALQLGSSWCPCCIVSHAKEVIAFDDAFFEDCANHSEYASTLFNEAWFDREAEATALSPEDTLDALHNMANRARYLIDVYTSEIADLNEKVRDADDELISLKAEARRKPAKGRRRSQKMQKPAPLPPPREVIGIHDGDTLNPDCAACSAPLSGEVVTLPCRHATCVACCGGQVHASMYGDEEEPKQRLACALCRRSFPRGFVKRLMSKIIAENTSLPALCEVITGGGDSLAFLEPILCKHKLNPHDTEEYLIAAAVEAGTTEGVDAIYATARGPVTAIDAELDIVRSRMKGASQHERKALLSERDALLGRRQYASRHAALDIFERVNRKFSSTDQSIVDVHGLHAEEAVAVIEELVLPVLPVLKRILVVTGRGAHSVKKVAVLRGAIERMLHAAGVQFQQAGSNAGALFVKC
ncbi:hypothetical protein JKP88DRAFT_241238 [Tribonema minus]|uniref:Smr domain-containing protein n=1 Tax=Tribonema minus TaxID=303371 RepID=A0A836CE01_9STRA|nr:hypothetical protein JKP88DRAFT_241238 [Tribonema minus]